MVLVGASTLRQAEKLILGCEACSPEDAELPFDNVLDRVTGNDPAVTDYILEEVRTPASRNMTLLFVADRRGRHLFRPAK